MPSELSINRETGMIEVRSHGAITVGEMCENLEAFKRIAAQTGIRFVLIDAVGETAFPATFELFDFVSTMPPDLIVAGYGGKHHEVYDDKVFADNVAYNRGINVRYFTERSQAFEWLLAQGACSVRNQGSSPQNKCMNQSGESGEI